MHSSKSISKGDSKEEHHDKKRFKEEIYEIINEVNEWDSDRLPKLIADSDDGDDDGKDMADFLRQVKAAPGCLLGEDWGLYLLKRASECHGVVLADGLVPKRTEYEFKAPIGMFIAKL